MASYKLIASRWLRKYSEAKSSPVYATETEAAYISAHLCEVPWKRVAARDATMTWHTNEIVHSEGDPDHPKTWSGLDWNVVIRDEFDAALFCSDHVNGGHRARANAACYRYVLPAGAVGKTLEQVVASVTSDPYNAVGARLALLTNSTGEIPMDCGLCRNGGRLVNGSYVQDPSYHTPDGGVVKRRVETAADGSQTWYPATSDVTLNPSGFVLQKYLFVFVLLENYNFARGNWLEGCSFAANSIQFTLSAAVPEWTEGDTVDCSFSEGGDTGSFSIPIVRDRVVPDVNGAVAPVVSMTVLSSGTEPRLTAERIAECLPQVTDELTAENVHCGVSTLYGKFLAGDSVTASIVESLDDYANAGVGFSVRHSDDVSYVDKDGHVATPTTLTLTASSLMIPFGIPDGSVATKLKVDWSQWAKGVKATKGSRFNFWMKAGSFERGYPGELIVKPGLYDGTGADGWTLLGQADVADGDAIIDLSAAEVRLSGLATLLITAYLPQDAVSVSAVAAVSGVSFAWYDGVTSDSLLPVKTRYARFYSGGTYEVGDLVRFGTNEAAKWRVCQSVSGVPFFRVGCHDGKWVGASGQGLWYTVGGDEWLRSSVTAGRFDLLSDAGGGAWFASAVGRRSVLCSYDHGLTWDTVALSDAVRCMSAGEMSSIVGTDGSGVFLVGRNSATPVSGLSSGRVSAVTPYGGSLGYMLAATERGIYRSVGGTDWTKAVVGVPPREMNRIVEFRNRLILATDRGVFRTAPSVTEWKKCGFPDVRVNDIVTDGSVAVAMTDSGIYTSADGDEWAETAATSERFVSCSFTGSSWIAFGAPTAGEEGASAVSVYRSTDLVSWSKVTETDCVGKVGVTPGVLIIGKSTGALQSNDDGATWTEYPVYVRSSIAPISTTSFGAVNDVIVTEDAYGVISFLATDTGLYSARVIGSGMYDRGGELQPGPNKVYCIINCCRVRRHTEPQSTSDLWEDYSHGFGPFRKFVPLDDLGYTGVYYAIGNRGVFTFDTVNYSHTTDGHVFTEATWDQLPISARTGDVTDCLVVTGVGSRTIVLVTAAGLFYHDEDAESVDVRPSEYHVAGYSIGFTLSGGDYHWGYRTLFYPATGKVSVSTALLSTQYGWYDKNTGALGYITGNLYPLSLNDDEKYEFYTGDGTKQEFTLARSGTEGSTPSQPVQGKFTVVGSDFNGEEITTYHPEDAGYGFDQFFFASMTVENKGRIELIIKLGSPDPSTGVRPVESVSLHHWVSPDLEPDVVTGKYAITFPSGHESVVSFTGSDEDTVLHLEENPDWLNISETTDIGKVKDLIYFGGRYVSTYEAHATVRSTSNILLIRNGWVESEPLVAYRDFTCVGLGEEIDVVGNADGRLFESVDYGKTWVQAGQLDGPVLGVSVFGGEWLAWTATSLYRRSVVWNKVEGETVPKSIATVAYANGRWVVGFDRGYAWSSDLETWHEVSVDAGVVDLVYSDGMWMSACTDGVRYSSDVSRFNRLTVAGHPTPGFSAIFHSTTSGKWYGGSASNCGLYVSDDGHDWVPTNVTTGIFYDICEFGGTIVAAGLNGIYTGSGQSFTKVAVADCTVTRLCATEGKCVAVGNGCLYVTSNGTTWTDVFGKFTKVVTCDPDQLSNKTVAVGKYGLFHSVDCKSWTPVSGITGAAPFTLSYSDGMWMSATEDGKTWRYSSNGESWTALPELASAALCLRHASSKWFAATTSTVYYKTDAASTWSSSSPSVGTILGLACVNGSVYAVGSSGVARTSTGSSWTALTGGPSEISAFDEDNSGYSGYVAIVGSDGKLYRARNSGNTIDEVPLNTDLNVTGVKVAKINRATELLVFTDDPDGRGFDVSGAGETLDDSHLYVREGRGFPTGVLQIRSAGSNSHVFAVTADGLYLVSLWYDFGNTDRVTKMSLAFSARGLYGVGAATVQSGYSSLNVPAAFANGVVYRSTDINGNEWERAFRGGCADLRGVAFGDDTWLAVGDAAFTSSDGATWTPATVPAVLNDVAYYEAGDVWLIGGDTGLWSTSAVGSAWTKAANTVNYIRKFRTSEASVIACATGGVYTSDDGLVWEAHKFADVIMNDARFTEDLDFKPTGVTGQFKDLAYADGVFTAITPDVTYSSTDGTSWKGVKTGNGMKVKSVGTDWLWLWLNGTTPQVRHCTSGYSTGDATFAKMYTGVPDMVAAPNGFNGNTDESTFLLHTSTGYFRVYNGYYDPGPSYYNYMQGWLCQPFSESKSSVDGIFYDYLDTSSGYHNAEFKIESGTLYQRIKTGDTWSNWKAASILRVNDATFSVSGRTVSWTRNGTTHTVSGVTLPEGVSTVYKSFNGFYYRTTVDGQNVYTYVTVPELVAELAVPAQTVYAVTAYKTMTMYGASSACALAVTASGMMKYVTSSNDYNQWQFVDFAPTINHGRFVYNRGYSSAGYCLRAVNEGTTGKVQLCSADSYGFNTWYDLDLYPGTKPVLNIGFTYGVGWTVYDEDGYYLLPVPAESVYSAPDPRTVQWSTFEWPATVPTEVSSGKVRVKIVNGELYASAGYRWVAAGVYARMSGASLIAGAAVMSTNKSDQWVLRQLGTMNGTRTTCALYSVAQAGNLWIVSGQPGSAWGTPDDENWTPIQSHDVVPVTFVGASEDNGFCCLYGHGIMYSGRSMTRWSPSTMTAGTFYGVASSGGYTVAAGTAGLWYTVGDGVVSTGREWWIASSSEDVAYSSYSDVVFVNGSWIAVGESGVVVCRGTAPNGSWVRRSVTPGYCICVNDNMIVVGCDNGVNVSVDGGSTWRFIRLSIYGRFGKVICSGGTFVAISSIMASEGLNDPDLFVSTDGVTWIRGNLDLDSSYYGIGQFSDIDAYDGVMICSRSNYRASGVGGLYRSFDNGVNWEPILSTRGVGFDIVAWSRTQKCWHAAGPSGIYRSLDEGETWDKVEDGVSWGSLEFRFFVERFGMLFCGFDDPTGILDGGSFNLLRGVSVDRVHDDLYRCVRKSDKDGMFVPSKWELVPNAPRDRMHGEGMLCIPDVTLFCVRS